MNPASNIDLFVNLQKKKRNFLSGIGNIYNRPRDELIRNTASTDGGSLGRIREAFPGVMFCIILTCKKLFTHRLVHLRNSITMAGGHLTSFLIRLVYKLKIYFEKYFKKTIKKHCYRNNIIVITFNCNSNSFLTEDSFSVGFTVGLITTMASETFESENSACKVENRKKFHYCLRYIQILIWKE